MENEQLPLINLVIMARETPKQKGRPDKVFDVEKFFNDVERTRRAWMMGTVQLAKCAGVPSSVISKMKKPTLYENYFPNLSTVYRLAKVLDLNLNDYVL